MWKQCGYTLRYISVICGRFLCTRSKRMSKNKKLVYYYDTETCSYHPAEKDLTFNLKFFLSVGIVMAVAIVGATLGYAYYFAPLQQEKLTHQSETLSQKVEAINQKLDALDGSLGDLNDRDNSFYRPLLQTGRIPASYYELGKGGTERYSRNSSNIIQSTDLRFEQFLHRIAVQKESYGELIVLAEEKSESMKFLPCILPVNGNMISGFGYRKHPISGHTTLHTGVDFACGIGTPIYATADGVVKEAHRNGHGYGIVVNLNHGNGFETKYAHLSKAMVKEGQQIKRGQLIAYSGNTGRSTGPHLHYELIKDGVKVDPADYIYGDLLPMEYQQLKSLQAVPMD